VVSILVTIGALVLLLGVAVGSLVTPVPRWAERARSLAFWRRESVRQRFHQRRWLFLSYLGLAAIAGVTAVIWVLPAVLTRHPHIDSAADRHQAIAATRTGLVAGLAAIGAAGGLAYTARTYRLSREGHVTDRYSKAVEQLGDENVEVRLGGIYALERLMRDSPADQPTIMETLCAYVRQHAPRNPPPATVDRDRRVAGHRRPRSVPASNRLAEDVQAILTVLGRRRPVANEGRMDLSNTDLTGAQLEEENLTDANLAGANLTRVRLVEANLTDAELAGANLTGANLAGANLIRAQLDVANLTNAQLVKANLTDAQLDWANLTRAWLVEANLTGAQLDGAHLICANLAEANLTDAELVKANLTDAQLVKATLIRAQLDGATLILAHLDEVNLTDARLVKANLAFARLVGATLTGAQLDRADLTGAVFTSGALSPEQRARALHVDEISSLPR
jgi:uncharacterized protein YjbI with pentapeptide repeats